MGSDRSRRWLVEPAHYAAGHWCPYTHANTRFAQHRAGPFIAGGVGRIMADTVIEQVVLAIGRIGRAPAIGG